MARPKTADIQLGPFRRYVSSVARHLAPNDAITGDSRDVLINPLEGALQSRSGSTIIGDTDSASLEVTGLLESKWSARPRRLIALTSPTATDGYEMPATLYTKETAITSAGADSGKFGTLYVRSSNGPANYQLCKEFGATHYPTSAGTYSGAHNFKWAPMWVESGEGGYTRGAFEFARRQLCPGSRDVLESGSWLYFPNLDGTPLRWNKRYNESSGSGSEVNRALPSGPLPPSHMPTVAAGTAAAGSGVADAAWEDGDSFYFSLLYQFEDGSYWMPLEPRARNANLPSGYGFVTIGTVGGTAKYRDVAWTLIPYPPDGVVAILLLRSNKQKLSTATDTLTIAPGDLKICGVLRNVTQRSFTDSNGTDTGLIEDADIVRLDHSMGRRSRYLFTGDQHAINTYTLPHPGGIQLVAIGATNTHEFNIADTAAGMYSADYVMLYRVTSAALQLCISDRLSGGTPLQVTSITLNSTTSLQDVVDQINATAIAATPPVTGGQWRAALLPGTDGTLPSTNLCETTRDVTNCTTTNNSTTLTTSSSFATIPVGAKISGTGITAGTYVVSKASNTSLTLSAVATANGTVTLTFFADCGDNGVGTAFHATQKGYIRAYGSSLPQFVYLKRSAQSGYDRPDKLSPYFTNSSPGAASSGVSLAPNNWFVGNKRFAPTRLGIAQGGVDIEGAAVLAYSKGMKLFINVRGVNTGEDFDYRLLTINERRGCCSWMSLVAGDGWATYATPQGIVAVDKNRLEKNISNDIHNTADGTGDLNYELGQCTKAAGGDTDSAYLYAAVLGNQLHITFRASAAASYPNRRMVYDFGPGIDASGLEELINPDTKQWYGWSSPLTHRFSCMAEVVTSSGRLRFAAMEANASGTGDGRLEQFDTGTADDTVAYSPKGYSKTLISPAFTKVSLSQVEVIHFSPDSTNVKLAAYRDLGRAERHDRTLTSSGTDPLTAEVLEWQQLARPNTRSLEFRWTDDSSTATAKLWQATIRFKGVQAYT